MQAVHGRSCPPASVVVEGPNGVTSLLFVYVCVSVYKGSFWQPLFANGLPLFFHKTQNCAIAPQDTRHHVLKFSYFCCAVLHVCWLSLILT